MLGCFWANILAVCESPHPFPLNTHLGALAGGLGSFPLDCPTCLAQSDSRPASGRHSEFDILWQALTPPRKFSALPPPDHRRGQPQSCFGENQLSPGSIGISPLSTPHPHPFQRMRVRPSSAFYGAFGLDMDRSPGFGSADADSPAPLRLGFPAAARHAALNLAGTRNSPDRSTESTRSRTRGAPAACRHRVSGSLSLPSRGSFHLSFTVLFAIGHQEVFSLAGWSPLLQPGFLVSRPTPDPAARGAFSGTGLSPPAAGFSKTVPLPRRASSAVRTPRCVHRGLGSSGSARRYSRNRCFFPFLRLLGCFGSPGSLPRVMDWRADARGFPARVSPFRNPRIDGYVLLPAAYRSLSRLSSAPGAKASALCPFLPDLSPSRRGSVRRGRVIAFFEICFRWFVIRMS